ncbi:MAG: SGNH/GDSL hydrolase family protein [Chthoniobacteraceae bacterium]
MNPVKIVFLGDSITGASNLAHYMKFSHIVECMIEARWGAGHAAALNRGIAGDTTGGVLKRLQSDVLDVEPDIVVLLIGGNDAGDSQPEEVTRTNLGQIATSLRAAGTRVLMLQYHLLPNPANPEAAWKHLISNNSVIAEVAAGMNFPVLDMQPSMQAALETQEVTELVNGLDGVHLNPGGELIYARTVFAKLLELGWLDDAHNRPCFVLNGV